MICPFCGKHLPAENSVEHLIVTLDSAGYHHVHGPLSNKPVMAMLLQRIAKEAGIVLRVSVPREMNKDE